MKDLKIDGDKILLIGNRGNKNLGDEIILIGLIKLLIKQNKNIFIACTNKEWLKNFHNHFFGTKNIEYILELPKGFRSFGRFLLNLKDLKYYFSCDSIIVGGGEILTEETPFSYWYWFFSTFPFLFWKKIYLMGGVQIPEKIRNKIAFKILISRSKKIYIRDYDLKKQGFLHKKIEFFPDTSFFMYESLDNEKYLWNFDRIEKKQSIIVNLNKKAENFRLEICNIIDDFYRKDYDIYFARICKSPKDDDIEYFYKLQEKYPHIKLLDFEKDFDLFLKKLRESEKVFCTRLHLFLISRYLNCDVQGFVYEKKVEKMKKVLNNSESNN